MSHGLLWLPLLFAFVLLASLGWLERRRQTLFRTWAKGSELAKLDGSGGAQLKNGQLQWSRFEAGKFEDQGWKRFRAQWVGEVIATRCPGYPRIGARSRVCSELSSDRTRYYSE